jgi:predicted ATP-binding protein involved in virulence
MAKENNNTITNTAFLQKVHLKGYKSIYDVKIDLLPGLNVVIGPNGSGKSNFLEALKLGLSRDYINQDYTFTTNFIIKDKNYKWVLEIGKEELSKNGIWRNLNENLSENGKAVYKNKVRFPSSFDNLPIHGDYIATIVPIINHNIHPVLIQFSVPSEVPLLDLEFSISYDRRTGIAKREFNREKFKSISQIYDWYFFNILKSLKKESSSKSKIFLKKENFQFIFDKELLEFLGNYSPFKNIRINEEFNFFADGSRISINNLFLEFNVKGSWLRWNQLSDGERRLFYIFFEIAGNYNGTFLLEEPELGIHPSQLHLLMNFLKEQSKTKQIIISTHSPQVLNILEEDELKRIILTSYDAEKGTKLRKMKVKEIKKAQAYMEEEGLWLSDYWLHSDLENAE